MKYNNARQGTMMWMDVFQKNEGSDGIWEIHEDNVDERIIARMDTKRRSEGSSRFCKRGGAELG
jgi:hypothetical protein